MASRSLFRYNTAHAVSFLSRLLNSRSVLLPSAAARVWTLCFYCSCYYLITAYVPFFFSSCNVRVSADLWLVVFCELLNNFLLSLFSVSPSFGPTTIYLMTLLGLNRGFDSIVYPPWIIQHTPGSSHHILVNYFGCLRSGIFPLVTECYQGLRGSGHGDLYVRKLKMGCGHGSHFEDSQLGCYNCSHVSWCSQWAAQVITIQEIRN